MADLPRNAPQDNPYLCYREGHLFFCGIKKHASAPARLSSTKAAKTMNFASSACANAEEFGDDLEPISRGFMCAFR